MPVIQCDTRQQMNQKHHKLKEKQFEEMGYTVVHSKMMVGDYQFPSNGSIVVDTKKDVNELYQDLISDHDRFKRECLLAQECGIKLKILVESKEGYTKASDIKNWKNPQYFKYLKEVKKNPKRKPPASNVQLIKIMWTMNKKYGVEFYFCPCEEAGKKVIELLEGDKNATN